MDAPAVKVFICWSGERSRRIASELADWLPKVIPELEGKDEARKIFVSQQLEKGIEWFSEIVKELEQARAGILCLTPENLGSPWLHFEAGALAKQLATVTLSASQQDRSPEGARIYTYLHGMKPADIAGPLGSYQSTTTTREDTARMVQSLARLVCPEEGKVEVLKQRFKKHWPELEAFLRDPQITVPEAFSGFEALFQRKTFNEPLHKCADQNWIGRYDGARRTEEALRALLSLVRNACPRHQVDLYEMLIEGLDSYAMAIDGLLLRSKAPPFDLDASGELIIPAGVRNACESRRLRIKELVALLLDPLAKPLTDNAVRFRESEQFAQKKAYVHRLEHRILEHREALKQAGKSERGDDAIKSLLGNAELKDFRKSEWDLDRVYSYLISSCLAQQAADATHDLLESVRMELEAANAQLGIPSLMPLHYSLGAIEDVIPKDLGEEDRAAVLKQLAEVQQYLDCTLPEDPATGTRPTRDKGGQIHRTLRDVRGKLEHPAS